MPQTSRTCAPLLFARHGATQANLAGLRCGGDLDLPLADAGRQQAQALASRVAQRQPRIDLIVTSPLLRTRETAAIVAAALGGVEVHVLPGLAERRLGEWNLRPIAETQDALSAGLTPPGGESEAVFSARIRAALAELQALHAAHPLVIGSKGVARILGQLAGLPGRLTLANTELVSLDLPAALPPAHHGASLDTRIATRLEGTAGAAL